MGDRFLEDSASGQEICDDFIRILTEDRDKAATSAEREKLDRMIESTKDIKRKIAEMGEEVRDAQLRLIEAMRKAPPRQRNLKIER